MVWYGAVLYGMVWYGAVLCDVMRCVTFSNDHSLQFEKRFSCLLSIGRMVCTSHFVCVSLVCRCN